MLSLVSAVFAAALLLGTTALSGRPIPSITAAAIVVALVLFLTRGTGLFARRRAALQEKGQDR
jgi:hypothetical protein